MIDLEDKIMRLLTKTNTSYKYFFMLACIDSIKFNKFIYSFEELSKLMVAESLIHGDFVCSRYTQNDRLFDVIQYLLDKDLSFATLKEVNQLVSLINNYMDEFLKQKLKQLVSYVPYRLIITDDFSKELSKVKDSQKNKKIAEFSFVYDTIYMIDGKKIIWRKKYHDYILNNKDCLMKKISEKINLKFNRM